MVSVGCRGLVIRSSREQFESHEKVIQQIGESAATTTATARIQSAFQTPGRLAGERHSRVGERLQSGFARSAGQSDPEGWLRGTTVASAQFGEYHCNKYCRLHSAEWFALCLPGAQISLRFVISYRDLMEFDKYLCKNLFLASIPLLVLFQTVVLISPAHKREQNNQGIP